MSISLNIRHHLGAPYEEVRDAVLLAERLGFSGAYFPDHFLATRLSRDESSSSRITPQRGTTPSDCWTLIALLVPQTSTIRLGTLMTSATFRHPSTVAISVAQLNRVSGGRIDLGLGTNWLQAEHDAFGFQFPTQRERFELLNEQLRVITTLWRGGTPSDGKSLDRYNLVDAPLIDGDSEGRQARLVVGGVGLVKTPRLAARYADEVNFTTAGGFDRLGEFIAACDRACESASRDSSTLRRSVMLWVCLGTDDRDIARRALELGVEPDQLRTAGVLPCTPPELVEQIAQLREQGFEHVVLASRGPLARDEIELIGRDVLPAATF
jgi:alkanesulfonate monooxygenase